ncbi:phage protein [Streptococcus pyogenes]|uniref:hypothetical protein n=1 Tax=Streptococcus pyogenes TaxID=1314 RepID=UPI0010A1575F|nr:hypothetical protein [Streptococcus pyogenes]VHJ81240.1 phage protein [Streptococcus pyogenes]
MTLVDDFYKQMEPSIKAFLDDNITIADKEEADRVYRSVKCYKKLNRLPPPDVLEWFQRIYTTEEMIMLIKQSYRLKQKKTDEDDEIYGYDGVGNGYYGYGFWVTVKNLDDLIESELED